ncbi:phosphoribosylformylglycinamidine synthase subunit PurL [Salinibacter altiplanensis]|uniref:phosphoribosylformylglycinamidine synthase subunit PurL n=1 Tax=Salinibacter altiplanensis TaxID=1803181 RepID=UPI000C9FD337|nr:phosphoribosylformylglycinamidine synthase subunit PurL [Salinibacter altiplanensis]
MPETLPQPPEVDRALALDHGLTSDEYDEILDRLGRTPTFTELGIYSVMWSEHCSYKNSTALLQTLPTEGEQLLAEVGEENAGLVDVGDGKAVAFKIESHNHPSAVEPYEGAATGVGGIHRDIFTMGARPICALDSLRFGSLEASRVRYLFDGVVRGIGDYGNSFGVPTVGGEVYFEDAYEGNPLVNAMSVGVVDTDRTASAAAETPGHPVVLVGATTGRDGIHGATFASAEIDEDSEEDRPSVQVGDPFTEKLLLEATLEAIREGVVAGIQDMGAAGITSSAFEMSASGGTGMDLYLDRVPTRETGMTPYEILLSESQERMLVVCEPGDEETLAEIYGKWDLNAQRIGTVTDTGRVRAHWGDDEVAVLDPAHVAGDDVPVYDRDTERPSYLEETRSFEASDVPDLEAADVEDALTTLLGSPNIASKRWVHEQYDTMVRTNTVVAPGPSDAAVMRLKGTEKGLAVKTDGNGRYVYLNPRRGAKIAVAEAARNVTCAGGTPVAVTNCCNFGNPNNPEVYWTFAEAIGGMGDACRALGTPVTGGNVSLYNEHPEGAIYPTPTIGMLGVVDDLHTQPTTAALRSEGDVTFLLTPRGWTHPDRLGGTEYLSTVHDRVAGDAPPLDLEEERAVQAATQALIRDGLVQHAHDVSDGGLAVCLAESVIHSDGLGLEATLPGAGRLDAALFGEAQSRVVLSTRPDDEASLETTLAAHDGVQAHRLGPVTPGGLRLTVGADTVLDASPETLAAPYEGAIPDAVT